MKFSGILFSATSVLLLSACSSDNGVFLPDLLGLDIIYEESDQCTCEKSRLASLRGGTSGGFTIKYTTTTSMPGEPVSTSSNEIVVSAGSNVPIGCTVGNRTDPETNPNPSPDQMQCSRTSSYLITDTKKVRPAGFAGRIESLHGGDLRYSMDGDDANIAYCAQACLSGDIFNCFPVGSGLGPVRETIISLYDSALSAGHGEVPAETAESALGVNQDDIPTQCRRGDSLVLSDNRVVNQALVPGSENWSCKVPSLSLALNRAFDLTQGAPALEVRIPNRFEADISPLMSVMTSNSEGAQMNETRVVRSLNLENALVLDFGAEQTAEIDSERVSVYGGPVRSIFDVQNLVVLETFNGCVSFRR